MQKSISKTGFSKFYLKKCYEMHYLDYTDDSKICSIIMKISTKERKKHGLVFDKNLIHFLQLSDGERCSKVFKGKISFFSIYPQFFFQSR